MACKRFTKPDTQLDAHNADERLVALRYQRKEVRKNDETNCIKF